MVFVLIMGALILLLGAFYLTNSWMSYHEWKSGTIIVILSLIATIYGSWGTYQHYKHPTSNSKEQTNQPIDSDNLNQNKNRLAEMNAENSPRMQHAKEDQILRQMQKNYSKLGTVSYDEKTKTYLINPTGDSKKAFSQIAKDPSIAKQAGWNNITGPLTKASQQLGKALGKEYSIGLVNPDNPNQIIFSAKNGQITNNIANQYNSSRP